MDRDTFDHKEYVRKPEEYAVSRISRAARTKLEKLRRRTGLNYASIIDLTLGIKFNDQIEIHESASGKALNMRWGKDVISGAAHRRLPRKEHKPPSAVLDAAILMMWKYLPNPVTKKREDLIVGVRLKIERGSYEGLGEYRGAKGSPKPLNEQQRTWSDLYPKWFANAEKSGSEFEVAVDNRVKFLIRSGFLKYDKEAGPGRYKLAGNLDQHDWNIVNGVNSLSPQNGLQIPTALISK
jgi:hypothetical protein